MGNMSEVSECAPMKTLSLILVLQKEKRFHRVYQCGLLGLINFCFLIQNSAALPVYHHHPPAAAPQPQMSHMQSTFAPGAVMFPPSYPVMSYMHNQSSALCQHPLPGHQWMTMQPCKPGGKYHVIVCVAVKMFHHIFIIWCVKLG